MSILIRKNIRNLPKLIKANHVAQAMKLENLIKNTFEVPSELKEVISSESYKDGLFDAFESGYITQGDSKAYETIATDLSKGMKEEFVNIMNQVVKEAFDGGALVSKPEETKVEQKEQQPEKKLSSLEKMEKYTKLLGEGQAENILRYTLGLPPQKAEAKVEAPVAEVKEEFILEPITKDALLETLKKNPISSLSDAKIAAVFTSMVDKYIENAFNRLDQEEDMEDLKKKITNLLAECEGPECVVVVDSLFDGISMMTEDDKQDKIRECLGLESDKDIEKELNSIAKYLKKELELPGKFCFLEDEDLDKFVLTYYTDSKED